MGGIKESMNKKEEWITGMEIGLILAILFFVKLIM